MKYERLTKRVGDIITENCNQHCPYWYICENEECQCDKAMINRLAELEDKIEKGTLIELPCKVGDTVYLLHRDSPIIECWLLTQFSIEESGIWLHIRNAKLLSTVIHSKSRGVCFTREEAEKRLKEVEQEKYDAEGKV